MIVEWWKKDIKRKKKEFFKKGKKEKLGNDRKGDDEKVDMRNERKLYKIVDI